MGPDIGATFAEPDIYRVVEALGVPAPAERATTAPDGHERESGSVEEEVLAQALRQRQVDGLDPVAALLEERGGPPGHVGDLGGHAGAGRLGGPRGPPPGRSAPPTIQILPPAPPASTWAPAAAAAWATASSGC